MVLRGPRKEDVLTRVRRLRAIARLGALGALALLLLSLTLSAHAALSPLGAQGQMTLTSCEVGASGFVKWGVGKLEVNVTVPAQAGQPLTADARFIKPDGTRGRMTQAMTLDAGGRGRLNLLPDPTWSFARLDVSVPAVPPALPVRVLTTLPPPVALACVG
jgi:hypothetical protein